MTACGHRDFHAVPLPLRPARSPPKKTLARFSADRGTGLIVYAFNLESRSGYRRFRRCQRCGVISARSRNSVK